MARQCPPRPRVDRDARHPRAPPQVQNYANLRHVQGRLGHGSLTSTERYLRLTITVTDLKEAHAKFHPREQEASAQAKAASAAQPPEQ